MENRIQNQKKICKFTDLIAWQKAHLLVLMVYKLTEEFPQKEIYSLTDQMRRAAVSISSNIAEGFGRQHYKEKIQFYYQSNGSLIELEDQILIAKDLNYFKPSGNLFELCLELHKLLQGLITSSKKRL